MAPKDNFERFLDKYFEGPFFKFRYFILLPVVFSLLGALALFGVGGYEIIHTMVGFFSTYQVKDLEVGIIKGIDLFLFGVVMMIFSMGLYDLFISKLEPAHVSGIRPDWLQFKNIDELKSSLTKVVIIILTISFFELIVFHAPNLRYEFLVVPAGIVLIGWGMKLLH